MACANTLISQARCRGATFLRCRCPLRAFPPWTWAVRPTNGLFLSRVLRKRSRSARLQASHLRDRDFPTTPQIEGSEARRPNRSPARRFLQACKFCICILCAAPLIIALRHDELARHVAALLGRFLPRLGPFAPRTALFSFAPRRCCAFKAFRPWLSRLSARVTWSHGTFVALANAAAQHTLSDQGTSSYVPSFLRFLPRLGPPLERPDFLFVGLTRPRHGARRALAIP
jgi:hypothetical protein